MLQDFEQIKTGKGIAFIDNSIIDNIACVKAFPDDKVNKMLYEHHKNLLRYAKNKNQHKEIGLFWDLNNIEKQPLMIIGDVNGFSMHQNPAVLSLVSRRNYYNNLSVVVMHNHPRNGMFSDADIQSFTDYDTIVLMTAVCNDGTIYMMKKEENFNPLLMEKYYNEGSELSQAASNEDLLKKIKKLKLNINNPEHREIIKKIPKKVYYYGIKNVAKHAKEIGVVYRCSVKRK